MAAMGGSPWSSFCLFTSCMWRSTTARPARWRAPMRCQSALLPSKKKSSKCAPRSRNACSKLCGAAWRAVRALGYKRLITYTLPEEGGASLRGAGFSLVGLAGGGSWSRTDRPRVDLHPLQVKLRWERTAQEVA